MSEKKKKHQQQQPDEQQDEAMARDRASHSGDLVDYDPEKAQDMIDVEEAAEDASQASPPNPDDPQHPKQGVPPGQENVPKGFTSGRGMQGGSANRRKR